VCRFLSFQTTQTYAHIKHSDFYNAFISIHRGLLNIRETEQHTLESAGLLPTPLAPRESASSSNILDAQPTFIPAIKVLNRRGEVLG